MAYQYGQLGPDRFQQLCQSLLVAEYPGVQCFPLHQADGGRDATALTSTGFLVLQAKYVDKLMSNKEVYGWFIETIDAESDKVKKLISKGAERYVFATNIQGSGRLDTGLIDKCASYLNKVITIESHIWWVPDIDRRLDLTPELKWKYPELLNGADFLKLAVGLISSKERPERSRALSVYFSDQFKKDLDVKFRQIELQSNLFELMIDVPIVPSGSQITEDLYNERLALHYEIGGEESDREPQGSRRLGRRSYGLSVTSLGAAVFLLSDKSTKIPRVVLEGGPGQGKSTITQFLCQAYRLRILNKFDVLASLRTEYKEASLRFPFRVNLTDLALWLNKQNPFDFANPQVPSSWKPSLEAFLAAHVEWNSGGLEFTVADLYATFRSVPVLVVLDGLDEMTNISQREKVVSAVLEGINRLESAAESLRTVVTSRPAAVGGAPRLPYSEFAYYKLDDLSREEIFGYAAKWLKAKNADPSETQIITYLLRDKLEEPHIRELARNPMQLAILLSLMYARGTSLPDKRTALYDSYVDLFLNREAEKNDIVRANRDLLLSLHRYLAWYLHSQAEVAEGGHRVDRTTLRRLMREFMEQDGYDETDFVDELLRGMVERIFAIVSREENVYEFEVQPLREYFAARYLYETAPYSPAGREAKGTKPDRFSALIKNTYWFNVARFYAGCYSKGELHSLLNGLEELYETDNYAYLSYPRIVALTLLSDWVFSQYPSCEKSVVAFVIRNDGLRYICANEGGDGLSSLPSGRSRGGLEEACWKQLAEGVCDDYGMYLIQTLRESPVERRYRIWKSYWTNHHDKLNWFKYTLYLDLAESFSKDELDEMRPQIDNHEFAWTCFYSKLEYVATQPDVYELLVRDVVERREKAYALNERSSIATLGLLLELDHFTNAVRERQDDENSSLFQVWASNFEWETSSIKYNNIEKVDGDEWERVMAFITVCLQEFERPMKEWKRTMDPWSTIVNHLQKSWGNVWVSHELACIGSGVRSRKATHGEANRLFDTSLPLMHRARYARLRSGTSSWWKATFRSVETNNDALQALLYCLVWASPKTIYAVSDEMGVVANQLSETELSLLNRSLVSLARLAPDVQSLKVDRIKQNAPAELVILLANRMSREERSQCFTDRLLFYQGDNKEVLTFCSLEAMLLLYQGHATQATLAMLRRTYSLGVSPPQYTRHMVRPRQSAIIEESKELTDITNQIARAPDKYPIAALSVANDYLGGIASRLTKKVGDVAQEEGWF